jgi:2-dehydropantoate 2-reductase
MMGEESCALPLQNGVEAAEQLAVVLGSQRVLGGLCQIAVQRAAPGHVRHTGIEPYIAFGELDNRPSQRTERLRQAFLHAGVKAEIPADIQAAIWNKFLFIAAFGGVGAVTRAPVEALFSTPQARQLLEQVMRETVAVAHAKGVNLSEEAVDRRMEFISTLTAGTMASMTRDILEGRPSELEYLVGALARLGRETGIPTPASAMIYASLLPQERRARGEIQF